MIQTSKIARYPLFTDKFLSSPNRANSAKAHGEPLGAKEVKLSCEAIGWAHVPFEVPESVYADWDARASGAAAEAGWEQRFATYAQAWPEFAAGLLHRMRAEYHFELGGSCRLELIEYDKVAGSVACSSESPGIYRHMACVVTGIHQWEVHLQTNGVRMTSPPGLGRGLGLDAYADSGQQRR